MPDPVDSPSYTMVSFYNFCPIDDAPGMINTLKDAWAPFRVLGRVYVASEGINAQMAVPSNALGHFKACLESLPCLRGVVLNEDRALSRDQYEELLPFRSLHIRERKQIVSDGLYGGPQSLNCSSRTGHEMDPMEWHEQIGIPGAVVLDCRNKYESDVGRFDHALPLNTATFRESWSALERILKDTPKDAPVLTYCTGGIRCVKINAYLEQRMGFKNVHRLKGGIISYVNKLGEVENIDTKSDKALTGVSKFKGVNYVFDERICSRVTEDVLANCAICGAACDMYINCHNPRCDVSRQRVVFLKEKQS
jgi:UPF0176 protein